MHQSRNPRTPSTTMVLEGDVCLVVDYLRLVTRPSSETTEGDLTCDTPPAEPAPNQDSRPTGRIAQQTEQSAERVAPFPLRTEASAGFGYPSSIAPGAGRFARGLISPQAGGAGWRTQHGGQGASETELSTSRRVWWPAGTNTTTTPPTRGSRVYACLSTSPGGWCCPTHASRGSSSLLLAVCTRKRIDH